MDDKVSRANQGAAVPTELRHLLFRPPEALQAIKEYHRRLGMPLPAGAVTHCAPESEGVSGTVLFRIRLIPDRAESPSPPAPGTEEPLDVVIGGATLAAALILYCRDRRIPLPAGADKSLQRFGEQVCLVTTFNPKQDELPSIEQMRL